MMKNNSFIFVCLNALIFYSSNTFAMNTAARRNLFRVSSLEEKENYITHEDQFFTPEHKLTAHHNIHHSRATQEIEKLVEEDAQAVLRQLSGEWGFIGSTSMSFSMSMEYFSFSMSMSMSMPYSLVPIPSFSRVLQEVDLDLPIEISHKWKHYEEAYTEQAFTEQVLTNQAFTDHYSDIQLNLQKLSLESFPNRSKLSRTRFRRLNAISSKSMGDKNNVKSKFGYGSSFLFIGCVAALMAGFLKSNQMKKNTNRTIMYQDEIFTHAFDEADDTDTE